jgi:hypothetical protein
MAGRSRRYEVSVNVENRARDLRASGSEYDGPTEVDYLAWWLVTKRRTLDALAANLSRWYPRNSITVRNIEGWMQREYGQHHTRSSSELSR